MLAARCGSVQWLFTRLKGLFSRIGPVGRIGRIGRSMSTVKPYHPLPRLFCPESMGQALSVYLPATGLSRMIGLLRGLVLAWLMAQEQWGVLQIALLVVNLLNPLCSLGLNDSVQRYVPLHETRGTLRRFLRLAVPLVLATGAALAGVVLVVASPLGDFLFTALRTEETVAPSGPAVHLTRLAAVAAFSLIAFYLIIATLRGLRMYRALGVIELAGNVVFTAMAVVVCATGWNEAGAVVGCYAAAMLATAALVAPPLRRVVVRTEDDGTGGHTDGETEGPGDTQTGGQGNWSTNRNSPSASRDRHGFSVRAVIAQMLRFSLWASLAAITWQVLLGYPLWYLHKAAGARAASIFAGVQLIAQGMLIVAHSIVIVVQAGVTKTWESRGRAEADRDLLLAHKATTLLLLAGGAVVTVLSPVVLRILPAQYAAGASVVPKLILFFLLSGHLLFLGVHFQLIERTRHLFVPWLLGVMGHAVFSAWWVRPAGGPVEAAVAASWAGVAGMSMALAAMLVLILAERRPLDRGSLLLIAVGFVLTLRSAGLVAAIVAAAMAVACLTGLVFDAGEKRRLRESAGRVGQSLRSFLIGSR